VSTKSFFEKSEFVRAYAEAVADNVSKKKSSQSSRAGTVKDDDEDYDPSYRDVVMQKMDPRDPRLLAGGRPIIDIQLKR